MKKMIKAVIIGFIAQSLTFAASYSLLEMANQPLIMTEGNSYFFTFSKITNLTYLGATDLPDSDYIGVEQIWAQDYPTFEDALLSGNISNKIEIWDSPNMNTAPSLVYYSTPGETLLSGIGGIIFGQPLLDMPMAGSPAGYRLSDSGGAYQITMITGNLNVDSFTARGFRSGGVYEQSISFVPEPSALSLLAIGLGGLAILRCRRS